MRFLIFLLMEWKWKTAGTRVDYFWTANIFLAKNSNWDIVLGVLVTCRASQFWKQTVSIPKASQHLMVGSFVHIKVHQHCFSSLMPIALNCHKDIQQDFMIISKLSLDWPTRPAAASGLQGYSLLRVGVASPEGSLQQVRKSSMCMDLVPNNCIFHAERLLRVS